MKASVQWEVWLFWSVFDYKLFKISTLCLGRNTKDWKKKLILVNPWFLWKYSESYFEGKLDETMHGQKRIWSVAKMYLRFVSRGIAKCI